MHKNEGNYGFYCEITLFIIIANLSFFFNYADSPKGTTDQTGNELLQSTLAYQLYGKYSVRFSGRDCT